MKILNNGYDGIGGIYVSVIPDNTSKTHIGEYVKSLSPPFPLDIFDDEAHMTVMYSRTAGIDVNKLEIPKDIVALPLKFEYWDGHDGDGYLVLSMISKPASELHDHILSLGAEHSFEDYSPHMTIIHGISKYKKDITEWLEDANKNFKMNLIHFNMLQYNKCKR